jgi:predicted dehydrogenase
MGIASDIFKTDRRIKLGIWGLGRGQNFINAAKYLNIAVVAGCDDNQHMREFLKNCPGAYVSDNEDEFLAQDFDAVLIATWFCSHAEHTLKALVRASTSCAKSRLFSRRRRPCV